MWSWGRRDSESNLWYCYQSGVGTWRKGRPTGRAGELNGADLHLALRSSDRLMPLWRRMREEDGPERGKRVRSFEMRSWSVHGLSRLWYQFVRRARMLRGMERTKLTLPSLSPLHRRISQERRRRHHEQHYRVHASTRNTPPERRHKLVRLSSLPPIAHSLADARIPPPSPPSATSARPSTSKTPSRPLALSPVSSSVSSRMSRKRHTTPSSKAPTSTPASSNSPPGRTHSPSRPHQRTRTSTMLRSGRRR